MVICAAVPGDLDVMEVLLTSDEVLPALAAVMAVGTPQVRKAQLRTYAAFRRPSLCSRPHAASKLVSMSPVVMQSFDDCALGSVLIHTLP